MVLNGYIVTRDVPGTAIKKDMVFIQLGIFGGDVNKFINEDLENKYEAHPITLFEENSKCFSTATFVVEKGTITYERCVKRLKSNIKQLADKHQAKVKAAELAKRKLDETESLLAELTK